MKGGPLFKPHYLLLYVLAIVVVAAIAINAVLRGIGYIQAGPEIVKEESAFELSLFFGMFAAVIVAWVLYRLLVVLVKLSKPKKAKIFISYPHEFEKTAESVARGAFDRRLAFSKLSFRPREDHNEVIDEVKQGIRSASVLLVVTGNRRGFFESEILAASVLEKPVILLAQGDEFSLPTTAYSSYPVLSLSALERTWYRPLVHLLHLAAGTRTSVDFARRAASKDALAPFFSCLFLYIVFLGPILFVVFKVILFFLFGPRSFVLGGVFLDNPMAVSVGFAILVGFVSLFGEFLRNEKIGSVLRQDLKSRRLTNAHLRDLLAERTAGKMILDCLWEPKTIPPAAQPPADEDPTVTNAEESAM